MMYYDERDLMGYIPQARPYARGPSYPNRAMASQARGQTYPAVTWPIPPVYYPILQAAALANHQPLSWLAAVCESSGWNPSRRDFNNICQPYSVRRFGLPGIWASIEELPTQPSCGGFYTRCPAVSPGYLPWGWIPSLHNNTTVWLEQGSLMSCICSPFPIGAASQWGDMAVSTVVNRAAQALNIAAQELIDVCGGNSPLMFIRWILGCRWHPYDPILLQCSIDAMGALPQFVLDEADKLANYQMQYAMLLGEDSLIPIDCGAGKHWYPPTKTCVDDCPTCGATETCNQGTGQCECLPGYERIGGVCIAVCSPACNPNVHEVCDQNLLACVCQAGYHRNSQSVCVPDCPTCPSHASCDQETGQCQCDPGYMPDGQGGCVPSTCDPSCADPNSHCNGVTLTCECNTGYHDEGGVCVVDSGGGGGGGFGVLGMVGLGILAVGVIGVAAALGGGGKRQRAQALRKQSAQLRQKAAQARIKGDNAQADQLERQAQTLDQRAMQLEQEAAREEAEQYAAQGKFR